MSAGLWSFGAFGARLAFSAVVVGRRRVAALASVCLAWAAGCGWALAAADAPAPEDCPPQAQPLSDSQIQAARRAARDRGFLWRIERDGRVSYLYGTLHAAQPLWVFPGPHLRQALAASDIVALELDLLDPDIQRRVAAAARARPDERLPAALDARLQAQIRAACLAPETMAPLSAMAQLATLTLLVGRRDGLDPAWAIDTFLAGYARSLGKPVRSLESPEQQIAALEGDPAALPETIDRGLAQLEHGQLRQLLLRLARIWDEGRADELSRYAQWCDCADTEADRADLKRMLDDRNGPLAERIDALHSGGKRVFAAVGALHMVGAYGLPALLARRGYTVQRIHDER